MQQTQSAKITVISVNQASVPALICVNEAKFQSSSKQQCIVYYQIPLTNKFSSIQKLKNKQIFLPDCIIVYKIINYVQKTQQIVEGNNSSFQITQKQIKITTKFKNDGRIQVKGTIINRANQKNTFADISLKKIQGYEKYYQYRKKYKTLQNITRKIQFELDHNLRLISERLGQRQEFQFSMDQLKDKQIKSWYIESTKSTKITIFLQQIVRIGDTIFKKPLQSCYFLIDTISPDKSHDIVMKMSQYLSITFQMKMVKNRNLGKNEFISLRLLQSSSINSTIRIGNQETINSLNGIIQLNPLLQGKYYDLQYGYLNQNLRSIRQQGNKVKVYSYLQRLTSSKQSYQHFINQRVLDLVDSEKLIFKIKQEMIEIPVTYLLEGYNSFHNSSFQVKFILEVTDSLQQEKQQYQQEKQLVFQPFKAIPRKLFKLQIKKFLNVAQVINLLENFHYGSQSSFYLKMKCQNTIYTTQFQISIVNQNELKKQAQQLELRTEFSQFVDGKFVLVRKSQNKESLIKIKSRNLQLFYFLQLTDTTPITFDFSTKKNVLMHGHIGKGQFYNSDGIFSRNVVLSSSGQGNKGQKSVICCQFRQIDQRIQGKVFNFKVKYQLSTQKSQSFQPTQYDVQVTRVREYQQNRKKHINRDKLCQKSTLQLQNSQSQLSNLTKQFPTNRSSFTQRNPNILLSIKLRKMHYNLDLNIFDNQLLIQKLLLLNRDSKDLVGQGVMVSQLPVHYFRQFRFQAYDQYLRQRVALSMQIYCSKQPFSLGQQHVYRFKIPALLWEMNALSTQQNEQTQPKIQLQSFVSSKDNNDNKKVQLIYNSAQQVSLLHFNHNDGISVKVIQQNGQQDIGYSKIRECVKVRCQVVKDRIQCFEDAEWYLGVLNMANSSLYFLIKMQFDSNARKQSSNQSRGTQKTKSKERSQKSNQKGGPDLFSKTLKNFDVIRLKQTKNSLTEQFRQLTAKYVQKQQMMVYLKKKINQTDEWITRRKQQMQAALQVGKNKVKSKTKKQQSSKPSIYRSICECGQRNPPFMGYCQKCLKKLRQRYEVFFIQYQQKSSQYEMAMFKKFSLRDKIQGLKSKILGYRAIINGQGSQGSSAVIPSDSPGDTAFSRLQQKQLTMEIQELKLEIFELQHKRQSQFERRGYQMGQLEKKIKQQDDQMWQKSQELNKLTVRQKEINQQIKENTKNRQE